mmetsp:Transcript_15082/g.34827  ORF Transcript_15082/g.34827 Transcript_15082/m.34827 type:complete len:351 (+) Transcript_15082:6-1058(+)
MVSVFFWTIPLLFVLVVRTILYVLFLLPAFVRFVWYYCVASDRRVFTYKKDSIRNKLDVYGAVTEEENNNNTKPVLIYFPGGAWLIGSKMWGAFLARTLVPFGVLVIIVDYRNYPFGNVPDMIQDVEDALNWSKQECARFRGDPKRMVALGQSAGGHLISCLLLRRDMGHEQQSPSSFSLRDDLCGIVTLSSPYDISAVWSFFAKKGMDPDWAAQKLFVGRPSDYDPLHLLESTDVSALLKKLPPMMIMHGTGDSVVPHGGSVAFVNALRGNMTEAQQQHVQYKLYDHWSHTDPILESLMEGDHRCHKDLMELLQKWTNHNVAFDDTRPHCGRMLPQWCIQAARYASAFQ